MKRLTIGERLLKERKRRGLTRESVAMDLDVSVQTTRGWEIGITTPDKDNERIVETWLFESYAKKESR